SVLAVGPVPTPTLPALTPLPTPNLPIAFTPSAPTVSTPSPAQPPLGTLHTPSLPVSLTPPPPSVPLTRLPGPLRPSPSAGAPLPRRPDSPGDRPRSRPQPPRAALGQHQSPVQAARGGGLRRADRRVSTRRRHLRPGSRDRTCSPAENPSGAGLHRRRWAEA